MQPITQYLPIFLDMGDELLSSGAEIFRVEDTLNRMGYACGAVHMNVFVITSSIVITMECPDGNARTQTKRVRGNGGNGTSIVSFQNVQYLCMDCRRTHMQEIPFKSVHHSITKELLMGSRS